jgi:hypothetical protein
MKKLWGNDKSKEASTNSPSINDKNSEKDTSQSPNKAVEHDSNNNTIDGGESTPIEKEGKIFIFLY